MLACLPVLAVCFSLLQDAPIEEAWKVELDDLILGSPVVHQNLVIVASKGGTLKAFRMETGEPAWTGGADSAVICPPAIHNGRLYVPGGASTSILDPATGQKEKGNAPGAVRLIQGQTKLFLLGGIAFDGSYILGPSKAVMCLEGDTGKYLWTWEGVAMEVGAVVEASGRVYLASHKQMLVLDAKSGKELKGPERSTPGLTFHGLADRDHIIFQGWSAPLVCYDAKSTRELWRRSRKPESSSGIIPPALVQDRLVLALLPEIVGLESRSGGERWKLKVEAKAEFSHAPPAVRGREVCVGANGKLFGIDSVGGKVQWTLDAVKPDNSFHAHQPAWSGDRLLYACGKTLYCYKPR